jgi:hypothetical protein
MKLTHQVRETGQPIGQMDLDRDLGGVEPIERTAVNDRE